MISHSFRLVAALAAVAMLTAGCSSGDGNNDSAEAEADVAESAEQDTVEETTTTASPTTAPIPDEGVALVDLQIVGVHFGDDGFVEIQNNGEDDADVNGIFICQFPTYVDLGTVVDGGVVPAGGSVQIPAATISGLAEDGGEAAIYSTNSDFGSSDNILAFVQWGTGGARGGVAAGAGLWPDEAVTVTPEPGLGLIELFGDPADPDSWG